MPGELTAEAVAEWKRVVPELERLGTLTAIDRGVLIRYCTAWAEWVELNDLLQTSGKLVRGRAPDSLVRNPAWLMRRDVEFTVTELGKQLGLSPAARLRAGVVHEPPVPKERSPAVTAMDDYRKRLKA